MTDQALRDDALPAPSDPAPAPPERDDEDGEDGGGASVALASGQALAHGGEVIHWSRTLAAVGLILLAALGAAGGLYASRKKAPRRKARPVPTGVRVAIAEVRDVRPEVVGLGRARPSRKVVISAQVGGLVEAVHERIEDGAFVEGGVLAVQIERADHEAEEQRQRAQVHIAQAEQRRLEAEVAHITSRISVTREQLDLELDNLERAKELLRKGVGTDRELETARLLALRSRNSLLTLESAKALLGPQIEGAEARVSEARARHGLAALQLKRTTVRTPFPGLVAEVDVEEHQLISPGARLFELWQIEQVDVPVVLSLREGMLLSPDLGVHTKGKSDEVERVEVEHEADGQIARWEGVLLRFEPIDGDTQTVKAVVRVDNPPGETPLLPEVFCRVRMLSAVSRRGLTIPASAVQEEGRIYVVRDGHLAIVNPKLGRRLGRWILVEGGIVAGDQVIVSPLEKVIEGIELKVLEVVR